MSTPFFAPNLNYRLRVLLGLIIYTLLPITPVVDSGFGWNIVIPETVELLG